MELVVDAVGRVVWPVTVVVIGLMFRTRISSAVTEFLGRASLRELRAGGSGFSATFEARKQVAADREGGPTQRPMPLSPGQTYGELKQIQDAKATPDSERLYRQIATYVDALGIDENSKVDFLTKEVAILYTSLRTLDVARAIFRSQFDLLADLRDENDTLSSKEAQQRFIQVVSDSPYAFVAWDYVKYLSYLISTNLIEYKAGTYLLTPFGVSFVDVMRANPRLIKDLVPI